MVNEENAVGRQKASLKYFEAAQVDQIGFESAFKVL